ncbi:MAG: hypothetical protein WAN48_11530 [Actinomycetes bacterium]
MTDERDPADFSPARVPVDEPVAIPAPEVIAEVDASEDEDLGEDVEDTEV